MIFVILGLILVSVVGYSLSPFELSVGYEPKKEKALPHQPYVIGVNKFLVPWDEWLESLHTELNKMTSQYDEPVLPDMWIYLNPIPDPNEKPVIKVQSAYTGVRSHNEVRYALNNAILYSKECEKCLQPTLTDAKQRYCKVCTNNMAEAEKNSKLAKMKDKSQWILDTSYVPHKSAPMEIVDGEGRTTNHMSHLTFVRYKNIYTGEYKIEAHTTGNTRLRQLSGMSRADLWAEAQSLQLAVDGTLTKGELISMIRTVESTLGLDDVKSVKAEFLKPLGEYTRKELSGMTKSQLTVLAHKYDIELNMRQLKIEMVDIMMQAGTKSQYEQTAERIQNRIASMAQVPPPISHGSYDSMWQGAFDLG